MSNIFVFKYISSLLTANVHLKEGRNVVWSLLYQFLCFLFIFLRISAGLLIWELQFCGNVAELLRGVIIGDSMPQMDFVYLFSKGRPRLVLYSHPPLVKNKKKMSEQWKSRKQVLLISFINRCNLIMVIIYVEDIN